MIVEIDEAPAVAGVFLCADAWVETERRGREGHAEGQRRGGRVVGLRIWGLLIGLVRL